jgi:hypothetical protein
MTVSTVISHWQRYNFGVANLRKKCINAWNVIPNYPAVQQRLISASVTNHGISIYWLYRLDTHNFTARPVQLLQFAGQLIVGYEHFRCATPNCWCSRGSSLHHPNPVDITPTTTHGST